MSYLKADGAKARKRTRTEALFESEETVERPAEVPPLPPKAEGRIRGVLAKSPLAQNQPQNPGAGQTDLKYLVEIGYNNNLECPLCAAVLCTRGSLKKHINLHLKGAKVHCTMCDARFQTEAALNYHKESKHAGKDK